MTAVPRICIEEDPYPSMHMFEDGVKKIALDIANNPKTEMSIDISDTVHEDVLGTEHDHLEADKDLLALGGGADDNTYMSLRNCVVDVFKKDMSDMLQTMNITEISQKLENYKPPPLPPRRPRAQLQESIYKRQESDTKEEVEGGDINMLVIHNLDVNKVSFIMDSRKYQQQLNDQLKQHRAEVQWDSVKEDRLMITEVAGSRRPASQEDVQSWREDTELTTKAFFKDIMVRKITVLQTTWDVMKERDLVSTVPVSDPDMAKILPSDELPGVIIVGDIVTVSIIVDRVLSLVKTTEETNMEKSGPQTSSLHEMATWKLRYLLAIDFQSELSDKYSGLKLDFDMKKKVIEVTGSGLDVTKAKFDIQDVLQGVEFKPIPGLSKVLLQAYTYDEFHDYIQKCLAQQNIQATFEVKSDKLLVYGKGQRTLDVACRIIVDSVKCTYINTDGLAIDVWKKVLDSINQAVTEPFYIDNVDDSKGGVLICAANIHDLIMTKIREATQGSTLEERKLKLEKGVFLVLKRRCVQDICTLKSKHKVKVSFDHAACLVVVQGPASQVRDAVEDIKMLGDKVVIRRFALNRPGATKFIKSLTGDSMVKQAEDEFSCIIDIQSVIPDTVTPNLQEDQPFKASVMIVKGNIQDQLVDVIVNSVNKDRNLSKGVVGKVLSDAAGSVMQKQLNRRYFRDLQNGEIAVTSGGNLRCKNVFHCYIQQWTNNENIIESYQETIKLCLEYADVSNYSSIAFPALGCFRRGYPPHLAARAMLEAIRSYEESTNSGIKEINIVISDDDLFTVFDNERNNRLTGTDVSDHEVEYYAASPENDSPVKTGVSIIVRVGELAETKADVLVNSSNVHLDLSQGAVSQSLLKEGGNIIQRECRQRYPQGIQPGQVASTGGGRLSCKHIYHCCLPKWVNNPQVVENLSQTIDKCLEMASSKGCETIAFPALGTGVMKYPPEKVASIFKNRASIFSEHNPLSCLKEILIVLYHKDISTCKAFNDAFSEDPELHEEQSTPEKMKKEEFRVGNFHLEVKTGSLFEEAVDAIVVPTDNRISLNDATGKKLIEVCGFELMMETKGVNITKTGGVITSAKNLPSSHILFVSTEYFKNNVENIVKKSFRKANKNKMKSISIPHIKPANDADANIFISAVVKAVSAYKTSFKELREINILLTTPLELSSCIFTFRHQFGNPTQRRSFKLDGSLCRPGNLTTVVRTKSECETVPIMKGPHLRLMGTDRQKLLRCEEKITSILNENLSVQVLKDPSIIVLTRQNIDEIKATAEVHDVSVEMNEGEIRFSGTNTDALMVYSKTQETLKMIQSLKRATMVMSEVQWHYWTEDGVKCPFPSLSNMCIEDAYKRRQSKLILDLPNAKVTLYLLRLYMEVSESMKLQLVREKNTEH